jgi:3-dehydroquinate dehydratase-1
MSFLSSKKSVLENRPLIVGALTSARSIFTQLSAARRAKIDLIEIRLDTFPATRGRELIAHIKKIRTPILLTLRAHDEAGRHVPASARLSDTRRDAIYKELIPLVQMIDVEIRHRALAKELTRFAHSRRVDVIHSVHDFKRVPSLSTLSALWRASKSLGGDFFKVAAQPKDNDELEKFLRWGWETSATIKKPLPVLIGMGTVGLMSRVAAFSFGSVLTYGHLGVSAAPGQLSVGELARLIRSVYR